MKKLLAAGVMLAFTSLNAQMLSFGLRGGMQVHSKHTDCKFTDIGLIGSLKLPLLDIGTCMIETKVKSRTNTLVSISQPKICSFFLH